MTLYPNVSDTDSTAIIVAFVSGTVNGGPKTSIVGYEARSTTKDNMPVPMAMKMKGIDFRPKKIKIKRGPTTKRSFQPKIRCKTAPKMRTYNTIHVPQSAATRFARCLYQP